MNHQSSFAHRLRTAVPPLLALLLTIALAGTALAQQPPNSPGGPPGDPTTNQPSTNPATNPPASPPVNPPGGSPTGNPPSTPTNDPTTNPQPDPQPDPQHAPHPGAPFTPPADCIVAHAATPAQLCPMAGGLQYYFIGEDGTAQPGPWIRPFSELAALSSASVYSGTNPKTGKSVTITYLAAENKIRISTFYPDNQYDTNKPYNFTVDSSFSVNHEAW